MMNSLSATANTAAKPPDCERAAGAVIARLALRNRRMLAQPI
jgi:hypothetical protein